MRSKPIVFGEKLPQTYRDTLLVRSFLTDGDIDFGKSDTKSEPCKTYLVRKTINNKALGMQAQNCAGQVTIQRIGPTD